MRPTSAMTLGLGIILMGLGGFVAVRPLWTRVPLTGSHWLDGAFAVVFLLRGWMNVRRVRGRTRQV